MRVHHKDDPMNFFSAPKLFRPGWEFESMGIGGLDKEFAGI